MDKVLVAYGRADASTGVVGLAIGEQFARAGCHVDVRPCGRAGEPTGYVAVVIGTAVTGGRWEADVLDYVSRHLSSLAERPTWLFQLAGSTPVERVDDRAATLMSEVGAEDPVTFNPRALHPDFSSPLRRRVTASRVSGRLGEWGRVRLWGLLLANQLPVSASA